jgi:hypothetical protein
MQANRIAPPQKFMLQTKNMPHGKWNDAQILEGITGREACDVAAIRQASYNRAIGPNEDFILVRARAVRK